LNSETKETAMCVRPARPEDLMQVARIHKERFDDADYLLGQYSTSLIAAFYGRYLEGVVFLIHANEQGAIDAFVLGGEAGILREKKRDFVRACTVRIAWESLLRPRLWHLAIADAMRMLKPRDNQSAAPQPPDRLRNTRLLSIAVASNVTGKGAAAELVKGFDEVMRNRCPGYELTVLKTNERARRFYEKLEFTLVGETEQEYVFQRRFREQ
jgi:ribosomal protein S18 acetylase RimI-like enzyme